MGSPLDGPILRKRLEMYLANHYTTLEVTVVSLALGVAGVVAGSLLAGPATPKFEGYQPMEPPSTTEAN